MSSKAAITTAMATRSAAALQKFVDEAVMRDNEELYFGNDGDVSLNFNTTRNCLEVLPEGQFVSIRGHAGVEADRVALVEHFLRKPGINADIQEVAEATREIVNTDFEVLGGNASSDDVANYAEGGIILETDGGANTTDSVIVLPHLDTNQSAWTAITWGTDKSVRWEAVLRTGTTAQSVTSTVIWAGLKLTNVDTITTDADSVFFRSDGTNWQTNYSIGNADTTANALAIAQNTNYHLVIEISAARIATMYINGTLYATSTALTDATDFIPYIGVRQDLNGVARRVMVIKEAISRIIG